MGIHATVELLLGAEFNPIDFVKYSPAIVCYITSMILGYIGLRYLILSVSSPICNSSGAVACILCLLLLNQQPDALSWIGIVLVCVGVIGLGIVEKLHDDENNMLAESEGNVHFRTGFIAMVFPILYCLLDGMGTFVDALILDKGIVNEESANIAYEYTFFAAAVICFIYIYVIKKERFEAKFDGPKWAGAICETAGQFSYIYAIGSDHAAIAAPMISAYCVFSVVLSRIFLKEKLSVKHYAVIFIVFAGIIFMGVSEGLAA